MNKMKEAKVRAIMQARPANLSIGYDAMRTAFPGNEYRSREGYERALEVCRDCCPDGACKMCGCPYEAKLVLAGFVCRMGKFDED